MSLAKGSFFPPETTKILVINFPNTPQARGQVINLQTSLGMKTAYVSEGSKRNGKNKASNFSVSNDSRFLSFTQHTISELLDHAIPVFPHPKAML